MIYIKISDRNVKGTNEYNSGDTDVYFYGSDVDIAELKNQIEKYEDRLSGMHLIGGENRLITKYNNILLNFLSENNFIPVSEKFFYKKNKFIL